MSFSTLVIKEVETNVLEIITRGPQGIKGADGSISITDFLFVNVVPDGAINGVNKTFTVVDEFAAIFVWLNGMRMTSPADFVVLTTDTFVMTTAPTTGDTLIVDYVTL